MRFVSTASVPSVENPSQFQQEVITGFYELNPFPGCNQLVVSNHAFILPAYRGRGYGQKQHLDRLKMAKDLGYSAIICTVSKENAAELHILEKNGWIQGNTFWNIETNNLVSIWSKQL